MKRLFSPIVLSLMLFWTSAAVANPQQLPAATLTAPAADRKPSHGPGAQFEQLLQRLSAPGKAMAREVYGIDLERDMSVGTPVAVKSPDTVRILENIAGQSSGLAAAGVAVLENLAREEVRALEGSAAHPGATPRSAHRQSADILVGKGTLKAVMGDVAGAIPLFQQAIALDPQYGTAHYNLACASARLGDVERFAAPLAKAISLDKKYQAMAAGDSDFDAVRDSKEFSAITGK